MDNNMNDKTISELRLYCRDNNLNGHSKYTKKQDLLNFVNGYIKDQQIIEDNKYANALLESEKEYHKNEQRKIYMKQREAYMKQREEFLHKQKQEEIIKKQEDIIKNKLIQETLTTQNEEYEHALKADLLQKEKEETIQERDKRYAQKISNEELDKMRLARLSRFS